VPTNSTVPEKFVRSRDSRQHVAMKMAQNRKHTVDHLQMSQALEGCSLLAADGEIGTLEALYFDDVRWAIRYLLVDSSGWLRRRRVLVSPLAVGEIGADERTLCIELTCGQIEGSPPFDTGRPISRVYEARYYQYYNWPAYWKLDPLAVLPLSEIPVSPQLVNGSISRARHQDRHLHLSTDLRGCEVVARDACIGHVHDLVIDTRYWLIRYMEIETCSGWPVRDVLLSQAWIKYVHWMERRVFVDLACAAIARAPRFDPSRSISHDYEAQLFEHYGNPVGC
jgi:hypothetical protein